jgi:ribose transport system substrate-binding protein
MMGTAAATAVVLAACGGSSSNPTGSTAASNQPFTYKTPRGYKGNLAPAERSVWLYDRASGQFKTVPGDAAKPYRYDDSQKVPAGTILAFGDGQASIPFSAAINKTMYPLAKQMGFSVKYCDMNLEATKAITCARQLTSGSHPQVGIIENWQSGVAAQMMKIYDAARVPVVNVDLPHPNGVYFGVDSFSSGVTAGRAAGQFAKRQWNCKDVWIYLGENPSEGQTVNLRMVGFADGIQSVCGRVPAGHIEHMTLDQGSVDQAVTKTTDWLTANPGARHILGSGVDQTEPGMAKAFVQTGRDGWVLQQACDTNAVATLKSGPTSKTHWIGCVAYRPDQYAKWFLSLAADIVNKKPVPNEVHYPLKFYNHDTIGQIAK